MTNQEFVERIYASAKPESCHNHKPYSADEIDAKIRNVYSGNINTGKIVECFLIIGDISFERVEKHSNDELRFALGWCYPVEFWSDIGCVVNGTGIVDNCAGRIERFHISEQGKFYNQDHKLIAENMDQFAEYVTTVEYDYHPKTTQRTYDMLRFFGWYEGRHIDTTAFEQELNRRGIELSKEQLDFFAEFSGLDFNFDSDCWYFYSLEQILEQNKIIDHVLEKRNPRKHPTVLCGKTMGGPLAVDGNGIIQFFYAYPQGRTTMECINNLCEGVSEDCKWIAPGQDN